MKLFRRITCLAIVTVFVIPVGAAQAKCAHTRIAPETTMQIQRAERSALCLVNHERRKRGLKSLKTNPALRVASAIQGIDMLRNGYFAHTRKGWTTARQRISRAGYSKGAKKWISGENIASGAVGFATPRSIVDAWLRSPGHRRNILGKWYRHTGLVVVRWEGSSEAGDLLPAPGQADGGTAPGDGSGTTDTGGGSTGATGETGGTETDPVSGLLLTLDESLTGLLDAAPTPPLAPTPTAPVVGVSAAAKRPGGVYAGRGPVLVMVHTFGAKWKR